MPDKMDPIQKEIRFSVVMYGGVSLAIYINGVSQEIFKMVRATARKEYHAIAEPDNNEYLLSDEELSGSEKVYRQLGKLLKASFVVDILSGTSAGGINAVYLAKSLANDQPFQPLKDLWIREGDINLLINDKDSLADLAGLSAQPETASLLNSQRMYYKLLAALDSMDGLPIPANQASLNGGPFKKSPYVGELDLFVTAPIYTDCRCLPAKLLIEASETDWRARLYTPLQNYSRRSENDLLFRLDLGYRLRRLQFLQKIINQLMVHTGTTQDSSVEASAIHNLLRVSLVSVNLQDPQQEAAFRGELHRIKAKLNAAYNILRDAGRSLRTRGLCTENYPDLDVPEAYIFQVRKLGELLNASSPDRAAIGDQIEAISLLLFSRNEEQPGYLGEKFSEASAQIEQVLGEAVDPKQADLLPAQIDARSVLAYFYKHYEYYDMVTYPILLDAPVGESGIVKVFRISPEDAPCIFDQKASSRKKLLGTKFANFGAFFDKSWRENDILWGRLDGAACLINALLPEESEWKTNLRVEAQDAILRDDAIYKKLQERVASKRVASKRAASNGKNPDFPLPSGGRSELIEAFQEFQMDEAYLPERIQRLAVRAAPVLSLVLKSMLSRRQYLRLFVVWIPPAARVYNAILKVRAFLHLPWKLRKPAQAKYGAAVVSVRSNPHLSHYRRLLKKCGSVGLDPTLPLS